MGRDAFHVLTALEFLLASSSIGDSTVYDLNEIYQQMRNHGLTPDGLLIPDEKIHRFPLDAKDSKNSGWYTGFRNTNNSGIDWYVFLCGNHRTGEVFKAQSGIKLDKQDRARAEEQIRKAQRRHVLEKEELQKAAAIKAKEKWESYSDKFGRNAYLERKGFNDLFGSRLDGFTLIVPMRDVEGNLKNIERIFSDGTKKGLYGGQRTGLFHTIGDIKTSEVIYVCEGFSTAVAVHLSIYNAGVVCCFNSGNLVTASEIIAKKYPEKKIVICGDNDQWPNEKGEINNVGKQKAEEAANICGGKWVVPEFDATTERFTDFYDLFRHCGAGAVKNQIEAINPTLPVETFDRQYVLHHPYPDENEKNFSRKGTLENVQELLRRLRIVVRYNVISKKVQILIPGSEYSIDNNANASLSYIYSWTERCGIPNIKLKPYLLEIADRHQYNPVLNWIEHKPWDGINRIQQLCDTVHSTNDLFKDILIRKWLISAVAAAYQPQGTYAGGVLVFRGKQNLGKTAWFKNLAPGDLISEGAFLRPDDKDTVFAVLSRWLVELGELDATFRKSDISQLKAFLTKTTDVLRRPYAELESEFPRRTVFFGSVNEDDYLKDPTGNRRFWTVDCKSIEYGHRIDMQQVWAEVLTLYKAGAKWILSEEENEKLNLHNEQFEAVEPVVDLVSTAIEWEQPTHFRWLSAAQACQDVGIQNPSRQTKNAVGSYLGKNTEHKTVRGTKLYKVPQKREVRESF